jgi:hypothetical protein
MTIAAAEVVISSSLHGIVFAHAYNRPAVWLKLSDRVIGAGFKFHDYYGSIGFRPQAVATCGPDDPFESIVARASLPGLAIDREALKAALKGDAGRLCAA